MPSTISAGTTAGTAIAISGDTTGALALQTNGTTTAMTVDTSQNVGIGTTSPSTRLHVSQALNADTELRVQNTQAGGYATTIRMLANGATGTSYNYIESYDATNSNQQWAIGGRGNQNTMCFSTNGNVERMRINSVAIVTGKQIGRAHV